MNRVTYYYTKYWESSGIQIVKSSDEPDSGGTILVKGWMWGCDYCITLNKDAFLTVKEARADVVKRQARAIKSLEKKILKVKAINPSKMPVK
jgi:hypothetical protein